MRDANIIGIVPGMAYRKLPPRPKKVVRASHAQGSDTGVWSARRNIRDEVRLTWTTVATGGSSRRRMGPGGNSVSAAQAKLSKTERTKPARSENPSLMIYEEGMGCALCRRRRTRDAACLPAGTGWAILDDEQSARLGFNIVE